MFCVSQLLKVVFLLFISIQQVKIEALNDSRQIGMCVYNVFVLSAVGLTFSLLLEDKVVEMYGIISGCVIIGTTLTQAIVFVPKVSRSVFLSLSLSLSLSLISLTFS